MRERERAREKRYLRVHPRVSDDEQTGLTVLLGDLVSKSTRGETAGNRLGTYLSPGKS